MANKSQVLEVKTGITKKLEGVKFEDAIDNAAISKAEQIFADREVEFKNAVHEEFHNLKKFYDEIKNKGELDDEEKKFLTDSSFQIKSIAANGGYPIATEVAKLLFEYCERVEKMREPELKITRLHIIALDEVLTGNFDINDEAKVSKLLGGLKQLSGA